MIDQIYSVSDISSDENQIAIDTASQTFIISVDTTLLDSGEIKIEESFFFIPGTDAVTNEVSLIIPDEPLPSTSDTTQYFLSTLVDLASFDYCLPYVVVREDLPEFESVTIPIYQGLTFDYVQSIDSIRVKTGSIEMNVSNQFPFEIAELEIVFNETLNESVVEWESLSVLNIESEGSDEDIIPLTDRRLPASISSVPSITINDEGDDPEGECEYYIPHEDNPISDIPIDGVDQFTCENILLYTWENDECIAPMTSDLCTQDSLDAALGDDFETGVEGVEADDLFVVWGPGSDGGDDECWLYLPGWNVSEDDNIEIIVDFTIDSMKDVWGHIVFETDTTITQLISVDESISLLSAHIADISDSDTNKIHINVENKLFTPVDIELSIENILNDFGQPLTYQTTIDTGFFNTVNDEIDLSNYEIRDPNSGFLEELVINNKISFDSENTQIEFGKEYTLDIREISTTSMKFDELYVYLQDFATPNIDMASVPAGFGNIGLPTLRFNLYIYNEINAPLTLNLDLMGITDGADPIAIHVEPELKFPDGYDGIDSTTISIYSDTLEVQGTGFTDYYELEARIDTLFSRDEIKVSGNAILEGESSLKPGKSFWGDVGIELRPLTIVFPEDITFSPQEATELALDQGTREKIEDGLIQAELFIEVGNSMPIGATLNMLTSDKSFFPLCFDTLKTGTMAVQTVSDTCLTLIEDWYNPDSIYVDQKENGEVIYTEFIHSDSTAFVGKLLALDLGIPTDLDENGFILNKSVTYNSMVLDTTRMKWLTSNDLLYIAPIINDVRTSIDTLPGYVTFHTIDYLQIRSFLTLIMDSKIVTGSDESDEE